MPALAVPSATRAVVQPSGSGPSATLSASVSAATPRGGAGSTGRRRRSDGQVDPVVELQAGVASEVLDGPLQLAGVALAAQLVGELGVDHHDEALVVGDGRPRTGSRQDLHLVGRELDATEGDRPVGVDLEPALAGRGHHGRDRGAQLLPDLRQERLDAPLDQLRLVADPHDVLDVDLLGDDPQERVQLRDGPRRAARSTAGRAAGGCAARPASGASAPARPPAGRSPSRPRAGRRGARPARPSASGSGGRCRAPWRPRRRDDEVLVQRLRDERAGSARRSARARRAPRGAWRTPRRGRRRPPARDRRRRLRRRYHVESSSMKPEIEAAAASVSKSARRSSTRAARPARRERIQRSRVGRSATAAPGRSGCQPARLRVRHEERVDVPQDQQLAPRLVRGVPAEEDVVLGPRRWHTSSA